MSETTKNAESAIQQAISDLQHVIDEKNATINIFSGKGKMPTLNYFAILFHNAFLQTIDNYKLSLNDVRVTLKIIEYMQWGNLIKMSFSTIAKDLGMQRQHFSRSLKKLKDAKLIIDIDGNLYLNPHIIAKGKFNQKSDEDMALLDKAAEFLKDTNISASIETPKMRRKKYNEISSE